MTSISFDDRPVGNIATVELRKTAYLGKEESPKAANTVLHNTDVYYIVDSVTKDRKPYDDIQLTLLVRLFQSKMMNCLYLSKNGQLMKGYKQLLILKRNQLVDYVGNLLPGTSA